MNQELQYFMHHGPSAVRFELAGNLNNEGARELYEAWRTVAAAARRRVLIIDMTFVTNVEGEGRALLTRWYAKGAQIIANSDASRELAEKVVGKLPEPTPPQGNASVNWTWLPIGRPSIVSSAASRLMTTAFLLVALLLPAQSSAAINQTGEAARREDMRTTPADPPAHDEQLGSASAALQNKTSAFARVK